MPNGCRLIVFAGPPCSGKTTAARALSESTGWVHLNVDQIVSHVVPEALWNQSTRDIGYRAMHFTAEILAGIVEAVLLDATYTRLEQRLEVNRLAKTVGAAVYLIECRIQAEDAARRFCTRRNHPASDLSEERVITLTRSFPFTSAGLDLWADGKNRTEIVTEIFGFIERPSLPIEPWLK